MDALLEHISHRPYPAPDSPWLMAQTWIDLMFIHWPVEIAAVQALIPDFLQVDTYDGIAWVGVVPFAMIDIHFRNVPPVPMLRQFPELNVRTYVTYRDKPGIYFFSLDAANAVAVEVARTFFALPYFNSKMSTQRDGEHVIYSASRQDKRGKPAEFEAVYGPTTQPYYAKPGSLEHWLTERYCFFTGRGRLQAVVGEVHHKRWPLQRGEAEITKNTMLEAAGLPTPSHEPILHFARHLETVEWPIRRT